ncbi:hypothetical protein AB0L13_45245 [Saccharopolyspora shandongensis]|uniref:hypothetical protein n=1 Tax=Saccharopolyspora shandongensis TaxID=418495 RepID=UPI00341284D4
MPDLRGIASSYVADGPTGVNIRTRIKGVTPEDEKVLRLVGEHLGRLAGRDLAQRVRDGLDHDSDTWADRKKALTSESSSRWAGSITKASHEQWSLSRRAQLAHIQSLERGVRTIATRLNQPLGSKGAKRQPGGYRTRQEWFAKKRRMLALADRLDTERADRKTGRVRVVRGGKKMLHKRHHLEPAGLTETDWRERWESERWFLSADGESGKKLGNETIRITTDGEVSIKLPQPLADLANAKHGRYVLTGNAVFGYRAGEWADRVNANKAVAYRIHYSVDRGRSYIDASWTRKSAPAVPLEALRAGEVIGVDTNADHLAAWKLDPHGNPIGRPKTFAYDLSGSAEHRDAQLRHALSQLVRWAQRENVRAVAFEELDFTDSKSREKHGRKKRFRQLISGIPTGKLRARVLSMTAEVEISVIAVDPAYTSKWGNQHWRKPLNRSNNSETSRHHAASVAIGRRALGYKIRRRVAPPLHDQSDRAGHRTTQAASSTREREGTRPGVSANGHDPAALNMPEDAGTQRAQHRSGRAQDQEHS